MLLALAGCGGGDERTSAGTATRTVVETITEPAVQTTTTSATTTPSPAPDPAATISLQAAERVLAARGYAVLGERDWRPEQTLKVLLGIAEDPGEPRAELAFFFVGGTFIGTDTKEPSGLIEVAGQQDAAITLSYGLYRPADSIDDPTGGTAEVTYAWDGSRLTPQQPIPPAAPGAPLSRR